MQEPRVRQVLYPQGQSEEFRKVVAAVSAAADIPVALATTMHAVKRVAEQSTARRNTDTNQSESTGDPSEA